MQLYAPDDGRGDARNMLSHTWTSGNKLVKLLHLVGWIIQIIIWRCLLRTYQLIHIFYVRKETAVMLKILSVSLQFIRPGDQPQRFVHLTFPPRPAYICDFPTWLVFVMWTVFCEVRSEAKETVLYTLCEKRSAAEHRTSSMMVGKRRVSTVVRHIHCKYPHLSYSDYQL